MEKNLSHTHMEDTVPEIPCLCSMCYWAMLVTQTEQSMLRDSEMYDSSLARGDIRSAEVWKQALEKRGAYLKKLETGWFPVPTTFRVEQVCGVKGRVWNKQLRMTTTVDGFIVEVFPVGQQPMLTKTRRYVQRVFYVTKDGGYLPVGRVGQSNTELRQVPVRVD